MNNTKSLEKIYHTINVFLSVVFTSVLWCLGTILIIPSGPVSVAMYHTMKTELKEKEDNYLKIFWQAFKENFKVACLSGIIFIIFALLVLFCILFSNVMATESEFWSFMRYIYYGFLIIELIIASYFFPILSHLKGKFTFQFKTALILTVKHFFTTLTCGLLIINLGAVTIYWPPALLFMPGLYAIISSMVIERTLKNDRLI